MNDTQQLIKINVLIGEENFSAFLYDTQTTAALLKTFPLSLNMKDLNDNEIYATLPTHLVTTPKIPSSIKTGDLMLYGNDCLVLFYENFNTNYSYTSLGFLENSSKLQDVITSKIISVKLSCVE